MSLSTKASDWQVAAFAQVGGGEVAAGGMFWFKFRSETAGVNEPLVFLGLGVGLGGSAGGGPVPDNGDIGYSPIRCLRDFSIHDLHRSLGSVASAGAGVGVGVGVLAASAFDTGGGYFDDTVSCGLSSGGGISLG